MKIVRILVTLFLLSIVSNAQVVHKMQFDRFSHYAPDDWITYAPATFITSIDIGIDYVYFGTRSGGILRYHLYDRFWDYPLTTSNGLRSNHIYKIVFDHDSNRLYAQTNMGIDAYTPVFGYWEPGFQESLPARKKADPEAVKTFKANRTFRFPVWYRPGNVELPDFFTPRGFSFLKPDEIVDPLNRRFHLNPERIVDKFSNLWLSTDGLGVGVSEVNTWAFRTEQHSVPNISVQDIYLDRDGVWIGGISNGNEPSGITFWNDSLDIWNYYESRYDNDIISDNVNSVCGNEKYVFFGTENGLTRFDKKNETWNSLNSYAKLSSPLVLDIEIMADKVFIATDRGLNWLYLGSNRIEQPQDNSIDSRTIFQILPQENNLLLTTDYGLYEYNPKSDRFFSFKTGSALPDYNFTCLDATEKEIWLAGSSGISFFNKATNRWFSFTQLQYQLNAEYFDIAFTPGFVWFASDRGLLKYNQEQNNWYLYTRKDGLASNIVHNIHAEGDYLWLSTTSGLTIFRWNREDRNE